MPQLRWAARAGRPSTNPGQLSGPRQYLATTVSLSDDNSLAVALEESGGRLRFVGYSDNPGWRPAEVLEEHIPNALFFRDATVAGN